MHFGFGFQTSLLLPQLLLMKHGPIQQRHAQPVRTGKLNSSATCIADCGVLRGAFGGLNDGDGLSGDFVRIDREGFLGV